MKKKLFVLLALVVTVLAITVISVSAGTGYVDDLNTEPEDGKVKNFPNWRPYEAKFENGVTWDNGTVRFQRQGDVKPIWDISTGASQEVGFFMFDMMQDEKAITSNFTGYYYTPAGRRTISPKNPVANVWYTYLMVCQYEEIGGKVVPAASIFYKEKGADEWKLFSGAVALDAGSTGTKVNLNFGSAPDGGVTWFDNINSRDGLYYEEITVTNQNGEEVAIEEGFPAEITEITVTADIYNASNLSSTMASNPETIPVFGLVTLLDSNGMMLDCATVSSELDYFENSFSVTLPIGDYDAEQVDSVMFFVLDSIDGLVDVMEPTVLK